MNTQPDRIAALVSAYSIVLEFDESCTYLNAWADDPALFARPASEMIGKTIEDVLGSHGVSFSELVRRVVRTGIAETREYSLDVLGGKRWFLADVKRAVEHGVPRAIFVARDITERKRGEEALRLSEERFRLIAQASSDVIWDWDLVANLVRWNDAITTVFGHPLEPSSSEWWVERLHPADRDRISRDLHGFIERKDRGTWRGEYRWRRGDGTYADVFDRGRLVFGASDQPTAFVGAISDLTEKKRMQQQLIHSDRLAALGTLSAGVAHEINNPLSFILSNAHFLALEIESIQKRAGMHGDRVLSTALDGVVEALTDLRSGAERVRVIVRDLKHFCRSDEAKEELLDVRAVLEGALALIGGQLRHCVTLQKSFEDVPLVNANPAKLGQVFLNLILNSEQAMRNRDTRTNRLSLSTRVDSAGRVVVEVADNGEGMSPDVVSRVFDPFFTTKEVGAGTGLGLSICHGIVTALGGQIDVESSPGAGAVFRVTLPPALPARKATESAAPEAPHRARVLIVDDEALVAAGLQRALSRDHDVDVMGGAGPALSALADGREWDVIFCDLMMPTQTGMDFHREVSRSFPSILDRVFFLSGGAVTQEAREFASLMGDRLLSKSTSVESLRLLVQAARTQE